VTGSSRSTEAGFSLIEMLVTVMIVGIAFAIIVGGVYSAVVTADYHRKQANVQAALRNVAEALKASTYVNCATSPNYGDALAPARTSGATAATGTSHTAPSLTPTQSNRHLLAFYALGSGSNFTTPSGMTEQWDLTSSGASRVTAAFDDQPWSSASATGTRLATSASGSSVAHAVLLENSSGIGLRAKSFTGSAGGTTLTITKPAGTAYGDAMVAQIAVRGGTGTSITPPAGWALISTLDNGTAVKSAVYQRTASDSTASFTWTFNPSAEAAGGIASYSGVNDFVATITNLRHWTGTNYNTPDPCPGTDNGLQLISLSVTATTKRDSQSVDVVKRRP
jgi:prepilin-type N-terminal cleavage/methylation domain-containing protein